MEPTLDEDSLHSSNRMHVAIECQVSFQIATRIWIGFIARFKRNAVKLSLCMIVRDNEDTLEASLLSIKPWVDEMIVVDTGSLDGTREIGRESFEFSLD